MISYDEKLLFHMGVIGYSIKEIDENTHLVFSVMRPNVNDDVFNENLKLQEYFVVEKIFGFGSPDERRVDFSKNEGSFFRIRSRDEYNFLLSLPHEKILDGMSQIRATRLAEIRSHQHYSTAKPISKNVTPEMTEVIDVSSEPKSTGAFDLLKESDKLGAVVGECAFFDFQLKQKCLPLMSDQQVERNEQIPPEVYSDALLEHPAIPGLMLTRAERLYAFKLEIECNNEVRFESLREKLQREAWKKLAPIPVF
jgi:hypothetical protein